MGRKISDVYRELEPYIVDLVNANLRGSLAAASGGSGSGLVAHALNGPYHTGALDQSQAPWFGVHAANANAHHPEIHGMTSADHTYAGGAALDLFGLTAPSTLGVITPSSNPGAAAAVLKTTAAGALTLERLLLADGAAATPALGFASDVNMGLYRIGTDILGIATNGVERLRIDANGYLNLGGVNANYPFYLNRNFGALPAGQSSLSYFNAVGTGDAGGTTDLRSLQFLVSAQGTNNITGVTAIAGDVYNQLNSGAVATHQVFSANIRLPSAGNSTSAYGYRIIPILSSGGSITNYRGFEARSPSISGAGTITTAYGIDIQAQKVTGVTTGWGVYQSGANDKNYFNGGVGIGTNSFTEKLNVAGDVKLGTFFQLDNTLKSLGVGITPDGAALADFQAVNASDHTVRIKQLTSQTGRLWRVEDTGGNELIVLDSQGDLQSGSPGFVSGLTGWQITPQGNAEFNNGYFRGSLHATIFVVDEFHATGGTLFVATAGKMISNWNINLTTGNEQLLDIRTTAAGSGGQLDLRTTSVTGSGSQLTTRNLTNYIDIEDPPSGHAMLFQAGQILRLKSIGQLFPGLDIYDVWLRVLYVEDMTTYFRYDVQIVSGGAHTVVIPAGCAVVSYGSKGDGRILLTSDLNYAPYQDIFISGDQPWNGDIQPVMRIGRLDGVGLPGISGIKQFGFVAGSNLANANSPYLVASDKQLSLYRIDLAQYNNLAQTVSLSASGALKLGLDVQNPNLTVLDFDPVTGKFNIGNALYPVAVNLIGNMTIQNPGAIATTTLNNDAGWTLGAAWGTNVTGIPTALTDGRIAAGLDASGNVITKVIPGSNVGTPGGAGLFLGADRMGYYSGGAWTLYMDNTGKMGLGGTSGARLAWDGTDLYGTDGTNVQWYARASTGKLYAGVGAVTLDRNGVTLLNDTSNSYAAQADANAVTFNRSGTGTIGRLTSYYLSGTTAYGLDAYAMSPNSELVTTRLRAIAQGNTYGGTAPGVPTVLLASGASDYAKIYAAIIQLFATTNATPSIEAVANQVRIYDDLRLDGSTNHALGIRTTA